VKRIILGTLAATAAIVAIPSAANAATCTYDSTAHTMDVRYRATESSVTVKPTPGSITVSDGGVLSSCFDPANNKAATLTNTNKLTIKAATGTGAQSQRTVIDETGTAFADFNPALDLFVFTGTNDRLVLNKGSRNDTVRLMEQTGGLALGPMVDLDYNNEPDLRMTTSGSVVEVHGGFGKDLVDALSAVTFRTEQFGEGNDDVLVGGQSADHLFGQDGNDTLFSDGDKAADVVDGGPQTDRAKIDFAFDKVTSVESFPF
jgi:Ca2+-binding RTX toxin-like protein